MAFVTNAINFPNLTVKGTPVGTDLLPLADSAAGNAIKQATISSIVGAVTSGGVDFLSTATAANVATLDFNGVLTSTYDNYIISFENFFNTTADIWQMLVGTGGGPTYQTTNYEGAIVSNTNSSTVAAGANPSTAMNLTRLTPTATSTRVMGGIAVLTNVNNSSNDKVLSGLISSSGFASGTSQINLVADRWQAATVLTSLRFLGLTGNIITGTVKIYGMKN